MCVHPKTDIQALVVWDLRGEMEKERERGNQKQLRESKQGLGDDDDGPFFLWKCLYVVSELYSPDYPALSCVVVH